MSAEQIQGIVRHVLSGLGVYLTSTGLADDATVQAGIGAVLTLVGVAWSFLVKRA